MADCGRCGRSGIGLATHGHGEPCLTIIRHQEKGVAYEGALKMIADAKFDDTDAVRGLAWCQDLARAILK